MPRILFLFLLCCAECLNARPFLIRHYSDREGLPYAVVYRTVQDESGYLWLSTDDGLCRFDGRNFSSYGFAEGLPSHNIFGIAAGEQQQLWLASLEGGVYVLDEKTDTVRTVIAATSNNKPKQFIKLLHDKNGYCWLLSKTGKVYFFKRDQKQPQLNETILPVPALDLIETRDGGLLAATTQGLWQISGTAARAAAYGPAGAVYTLAKDASGKIWCGQNGKIVCCAAGSPCISYPTGNNEPVSVLTFDRQQRLWLAMLHQDPAIFENGQLHSESFGQTGPAPLVNAICCDREGSLWLATYGDGLYNLREPGIVNYSESIASHEKSISMIARDRSGRTWTSTLDGLYQVTATGLQPYPFAFAAHYESGRTLIEPDSSTRFIGTEGKLYRDAPGNEIMLDTGIISYAQNRGSSYWMGSYHGLYGYDGKKVKRIFHPLIDNRRINSILADGPGCAWLASDSGLLRISYDSVIRFAAIPGLPATYFSSACRDTEGRLWLASRNGIYCIEKNSCRKYGTAEGLCHEKCRMVVPGENGGVWIATLKGLDFFDGKKFLHLDAADGLAANETTCLLADTENRLWVGTVKGLCCVDLTTFHFHTQAPVPLLESVTINGRSRSRTAGGSLSPGEQQLRFRFTALDYRDPEALVFSYRLNATDAWTESKNGVADFSSLAPGKYVFSLRVRNKNSDWSAPLQWPFTVLPPFWQTGWFILPAILLLAIVTVLIARQRVIRVRKTEQEKLAQYKQVRLLRQQSLSNLLNPHFVFNSLNSIQHFINETDRHSANEYLARFARLMRETMNDAAQAFVPLEKELVRLEHYLALEKIRFGEKLQYRIIVDETIDPGAVYIPVMLLQPYVENAIWHGLMPRKAGGTVCIRIYPESEIRFSICIEDDGVGHALKHDPVLPQPRSGAIMQQRLQLLSIALEKEIPVFTEACSPGTRIRISMPVLALPPEGLIA